MNIYDRMKSGEWIHRLHDEDYRTEAAAEMNRSRKLCFKINHTEPGTMKERQLIDELFEGFLPDSSVILPPFEIDRAKMMEIGENVVINHHLTAMSSGSINIGDGVMIGPNVSLIKANHDFDDLNMLQFKPITIKKGAWIGARAVILPGITIGEGAIVASGAIVTKEVAKNTIVGGNPAIIIREK